MSDAAFATEQRTVRIFASSSRRVRAYGLFLVSHAVATLVSIGIVQQLMADPTIADAVGTETATVTLRAQAGIAAYFLVIDWWSLRYGYFLPTVAAFTVGLVGGLGLLFYGLHEAVESKEWLVFLPWFATTFVWFRSLGWASSTGSGLARAIQGA